MAGLPAFAEAKNSFAGLVPQPFFDAYLLDQPNNPQGDALIPDLIVHRYMRDSALLGKIKRFGIRAGYANYGKNEKAVEKRARETEYLRKARTLDRKYTSSEAAPGRCDAIFFGGAFREANSDVHSFVKHCPRLAAARQEGLCLYALGSYHIIIRTASIKEQATNWFHGDFLIIRMAVVILEMQRTKIFSHRNVKDVQVLSKEILDRVTIDALKIHICNTLKSNSN